jgi:hypothetical protein
VMPLDRGAFSTNSAFASSPVGPSPREGAAPAQPPSKGGPETSSHPIQALASSDTGGSNRRPPSVAGDKFSVADITTISVVDFGHALEMPIPTSAPHVKRWYDQMQERESVVKSKPTHMPDGSPLPIAA